MVQLSSIERLPADKQDRIGNLCRDKNLTLDKLTEILREEMGDDAPSRSTLGRYRKNKVEKVAVAMRQSQEAVKQLKDSIGDLDDDAQSRLNYLMVQEQCYRMLIAANSEDDDATVSVKDLRGLSDALYRLSASRKLDADRVTKIRQEAAKETAEKAANQVEEVAQNTPGLSEDTVSEIKRRILGIAK